MPAAKTSAAAPVSDPPLLRLCEPDIEPDIRKRKRHVWREVREKLLDLAISTTAVRRAHRISDRDCFKYVFHYTKKATFDTLFPVGGWPAPAAAIPAPVKATKAAKSSASSAPDDSKRPFLILSPTELLNDPNEGAYFFDTLREKVDANVRDLAVGLLQHRLLARADIGLDAKDPLVFVASLCSESDDLNLWRFYGEAQGICFGIHRSQFDLESEEGISDDCLKPGRDKLYRVKYGDKAVDAAIKLLSPPLTDIAGLYNEYADFRNTIVKSVSGLLATVAYLFKTTSYESEREYRMLRIQSISDVRDAGRWMSIGGVVRIKSWAELLHETQREPGSIEKCPPIVTLGPQFDINNPERGQTIAIDRMKVVHPDRTPLVRLSSMRFRAPERPGSPG